MHAGGSTGSDHVFAAQTKTITIIQMSEQSRFDYDLHHHNLANIDLINRIIESIHHENILWARIGAKATEIIDTSIDGSQYWDIYMQTYHLAGKKLRADLYDALHGTYPQTVYTLQKDAVWDPILALAVWDRSKEMLNVPVEQVLVMACLGDPMAIMMLPAVMFFEQYPEKLK